MRFVKPVLVVAAIVLFVTSAHAAPLVTFSFHGTIFIGSGSPSVKGAFTNGDEVSGTYEFDPTDPGIFINGQKRQYFAIEDFTFDYGAFSAVHTGTNDSSITVGNNQFGVDTYRVDLDQGVSSAPFTVGLETFTLTRLFFELVDINESVFNSPALPSEPPDIGSFFSKNGSLVFQVSTRWLPIAQLGRRLAPEGC